jgi:Pyridoxamine 5'-phosphate oxidase
MTLSESDRNFLDNNVSAAMITVATDGTAKATRVGVKLVDDKLWSSGTRDRVRTKRLRRDPKATFFVYDAEFGYVTLETTVTILDGPEAPELNVRFFRGIQGKPDGPLSWFGGELDEEQFLQTMRDEGRVIYEAEITKAYGMHA